VRATNEAYPGSSELGFGGRLVLVVRRVQRRESLFARLADLLELLYMITSSGQINLGHLERGTRTGKVSGVQKVNGATLLTGAPPPQPLAVLRAIRPQR
jgi:hypothetical protein